MVNLSFWNSRCWCLCLEIPSFISIFIAEEVNFCKIPSIDLKVSSKSGKHLSADRGISSWIWIQTYNIILPWVLMSIVTTVLNCYLFATMALKSHMLQHCFLAGNKATKPVKAVCSTNFWHRWMNKPPRRLLLLYFWWGLGQGIITKLLTCLFPSMCKSAYFSNLSLITWLPTFSHTSVLLDPSVSCNALELKWKHLSYCLMHTYSAEVHCLCYDWNYLNNLHEL